MDDLYWYNLDVLPSSVAKIVKSPKRIKARLAKSYLPVPIQDIIREKTKLDTKGIELLVALKDSNPELLSDLVALSIYDKQKSLDYIIKFAETKLDEKTIEKCRADKSINRIALLARLLFADAANLSELHWNYLLSKRDFDTLSLPFDAKEFYTDINLNKEDFQKKIDSIPKLKNECYCWHKIDEKNSVVFCMRAFEAERIIPQKQRNTSISVAKTYFLRVFEDGKIEVPAGQRHGVLKIAQLLAKKRFGENVKFKRQIELEKVEKLSKLGEFIQKNGDEELKVISFELKRTPIPGSPNMRLEKITGLEDTLAALKEKFGIDLKVEAKNISEITFKMKDRPIKIVVKPDKDDHIAVICKSRWLSPEHRKKITEKFKTIDIPVTFGSGRID